MNPMDCFKTLRALMAYPLLVAFLRVALGAVFIVASLDKLQNPEAFATTIANYRILPYTFVNGIAIVLPWMEIITGTFLVMGIWTRAGTMIVCVLLVVFAVAIAQALARGLDISCGCFATNPDAERMSLWTLIWDLIWICWGILVLLFDHGHYSLSRLVNTRKEKTTLP